MLKKTTQYLKSSLQELKKVNWPTRKELTRFLITVVVCVALAVAVIALIDFGLSKLVRIIFRR